ncbi:hypothetical protein KCU92_g2791, partial [Aureobasidium melanogenum]|jgi:hypothetical protein
MSVGRRPIAAATYPSPKSNNEEDDGKGMPELETNPPNNHDHSLDSWLTSSSLDTSPLWLENVTAFNKPLMPADSNVTSTSTSSILDDNQA